MIVRVIDGGLSTALEEAGHRLDGRLVAYPNGGQGWYAAEKAWHGPLHGFSADEITGWIALGARYVGGCCGIGTAAIAGLPRLPLPPDATQETG